MAGRDTAQTPLNVSPRFRRWTGRLRPRATRSKCVTAWPDRRSNYNSDSAALSRNNSPSRTYRASVASLAWPVCARILKVDTPACMALVAKPARRLWPEKPVGSMLAAATRSLTMRETASPDSLSEATRPCRSTGRKTGPPSMPETASHRSRARAGQCSAEGDADLCAPPLPGRS